MTKLPREIAAKIDLAVLKPTISREETLEACEIALESGFRSVCVLPKYIWQASRMLEGSDVMATSVVDFPLGALSIQMRWQQASALWQEGAEELDIVMNLSEAKAEQWAVVAQDLNGLVEDLPVPVKVIVETAFLTEEEKVKAAQVVAASGAAYLKTSTGFFPGGDASITDIILFKEALGGKCGLTPSISTSAHTIPSRLTQSVQSFTVMAVALFE